MKKLLPLFALPIFILTAGGSATANEDGAGSDLIVADDTESESALTKADNRGCVWIRTPTGLRRICW